MLHFRRGIISTAAWQRQRRAFGMGALFLALSAFTASQTASAGAPLMAAIACDFDAGTDSQGGHVRAQHPMYDVIPTRWKVGDDDLVFNDGHGLQVHVDRHTGLASLAFNGKGASYTLRGTCRDVGLEPVIDTSGYDSLRHYLDGSDSSKKSNE